MRHFMVCALMSTVLCLPYFYCAPVPTLPGKHGKGKTNSANKLGSGHDVAKGNDPDADSDEFLIHYGYMKRPGKGKHVDAPVKEKAIRKFQKMAGLKNTGLLDKETQHKMKQPRCGDADYDPDIEVENSDTSRKKRYTIGRGWSRHNITWKLFNYTYSIPDHMQQRQAFQEAIDQWSNVSRLTFHETYTDDADIKVTFQPIVHGDGYPFRDEVLAHAFSPEWSMVHFNDDRQFTLDATGINLKSVALHEFGHSLGIGHSTIQEAIMYPYHINTGDPMLHSDDIAAIQATYPELPQCRDDYWNCADYTDWCYHENIYSLCALTCNLCQPE